jgi:hypothetical protein
MYASYWPGNASGFKNENDSVAGKTLEKKQIAGLGVAQLI